MLQSVVQPLVRRFGSAGNRTIIQRAIASLRARGTDAHLWLPGGDVRTYGPELVTNGDFSNGLTGWTQTTYASVDTSSQKAVITTLTGTNYSDGIYGTVGGLVVGKTYLLNFQYTALTGVRARIVLDAPYNSVYTNLVSSITFVATATSSLLTIYVDANTAGQIGSIDNISVREITSITPAITSGLTTGNYLESTGNTLATVDNPTGLVLDALGTYGPELVTNGTFGTDTGWTKGFGCSIAGGKAVFTEATGYFGQVIALGIPSTFLEFTVVVDSLTSGILSVETDGAIGNDFSITSAGKYTFRRKHTGAGNIFYINSKADPLTAVISSVSLKPVTGIHLTQTTTANKPVLRRGAYNYLLNSVLAGGTSGVEGSGAVAPTNWAFGFATGSVTFSDGTARFVAASQRPFIGCANVTLPVGSYIISAKVEAGSYALLAGCIGLAAVTAVVTATTYKKNNVTATGGESIAPGDVISALFTVTTAGTATMRVGLGCAGAATGDITLSSPQLETGSTASDYSPTTTAAASNPDAGKYSWSFDGSNDSLALGSVPFQMGDEKCVVVGARHDVTTSGTMLHLGGAGSITFNFDTNNGLPRYYERDSAALDRTIQAPAITAGSTNVFSCRTSGGAFNIRVNGTQTNGTPKALLSDTYTSSTIGARSSADRYMNGPIGPVLAIKGTVTDADMLMYERLIAALTPGAPTF